MLTYNTESTAFSEYPIFAKYLTGWAPSAAYSRDADGRCVEKAPEADSDRDRHESELQDVAQGGF
ncbi:hypothetical protein [Cupriavidus metallidurans]|uniref:hypothetical protein n=1 Tax=Cupriavidus metallidurans TaxID=119219 RepID=UPI000A99ADBC|nr:hypothetical protein [Cupriavidus metallidurans]